MSCANKHDSLTTKFCPECGQKIERLDEMVELNRKYTELHAEYSELLKESVKHGINIEGIIDANIIARMNLKFPVYLYKGKLYDMKGIMKLIGIVDEQYFYSHIERLFIYQTSYFFRWSGTITTPLEEYSQKYEYEYDLFKVGREIHESDSKLWCNDLTREIINMMHCISDDSPMDMKYILQKYKDAI